MAKTKQGTTIESVEDEMISLAMKETRKRIKNGTVSSQLLSHFLKEGTVRAQMEKLKLEKEVEFIKAKAEAIKSAKKVEELMVDALKAMKTYSGNNNDEEDL